MASFEVMVVSERATHISVKVVCDGRGFLHVVCEDEGKQVGIPKMTPLEARALAGLLNAVANEGDKK